MFGECQSMLYNYENIVVKLFGDEYSINTCLAYVLQFSDMRVNEQLVSQRELFSKDMLDIKNILINAKLNCLKKFMTVKNIVLNYFKFQK